MEDDDLRENKWTPARVVLYLETHGKIAIVYISWEELDTLQLAEISQDYDVNQLERDFHETDHYYQRTVMVAQVCRDPKMQLLTGRSLI